MNRLAIPAVVLLVLLFAVVSSLFTVHQTQQVLITQFGEPRRVVRDPGLNMKVPFIQTVIPFDRRLLDFDAQGQEVILGDQRRIVVDTFTRYRITDPPARGGNRPAAQAAPALPSMPRGAQAQGGTR